MLATVYYLGSKTAADDTRTYLIPAPVGRIQRICYGQTVTDRTNILFKVKI